MAAVVLNLNVDVNALLTRVKELAWKVANSRSMSSTAKEKYTSQVNRLSSKHDFWQQQITTFGLQSNSSLINPLQQAASVLEAATSTDPNHTNKCCSWSKTKKVATPPWTEFEERIVIVINALDSITDDLRKQREAQAEVQKAVLEKSRFSLDFRSDRRYVRLQRTEDAVIAELARESGGEPLVVLLHGEPGKGKSSLAKNLALQFEAEAKAAKAGNQRSPSPKASSSSRTLSPPLFERVIWLECGPQVKLEEAQLTLRGQLGWVSSTVNENPFSSKDDIKTAIKKLLDNQRSLIILDDVHDPHFLQQMLLLCNAGVKCLVTSQDGNLRLNCRLAKVPMEDAEGEDARRILASHIGLEDQPIPDETQGLADDIIRTISANPLAISCIAQAIDPRRVGESREWEKASEELSDYLDSLWGALQIAFERLTKQERNLLVLVSLCEGPSVPEEVVVFLYERLKVANSSSKFQASRTQLEMRQHITISGEQQQRSWRIHSLLNRFITEKKEDEKRAMFNIFYGLSTTESTRPSHEGVHFRDEDIVNALSSVYFNKEYAEKFAPKVFGSLDKSNNVRRIAIEPVTRLLVLKENSYSKWTPDLSDCVKQVFMKYISEGVLHEISVLSLLMSPASTIPMLRALSQVTESGSKEFASASCIGDILDALFKILGSIFEIGNKGDHVSIDQDTSLTHIEGLLPELLRQSGVWDNFPLIVERNSVALNAIVSTFTTPVDIRFQMRAVSIVTAIAKADPEAASEMANFPGLLHGLLIAIKSVDHHQNSESRKQALPGHVACLAFILKGLFEACYDIRLSMGSSAFSSILKVVANISCEGIHPTLQPFTVGVIYYLSIASICSGEVESIRIIKSVYEEGLFESVIKLIEPQVAAAEPDPLLMLHELEGFLAAIIFTLVDPAESKKSSQIVKPMHRIGRGVALARLGQYEDSIEDLEGHFHLMGFPKYRYKIFVKVKLGDLPGALATADSWINLNRPDQQAFQERGVLKRMMEDWDGALMDLNSSLDMSPDNYEVLKHRAYVKFLMKNDEEGARADAERALSVKPRRVDRPGYRYNRGMLLGETAVQFLHFDLK